MIVVALVAILAAVAMPMYSQYMAKSQARAASADLVALSLVLENRFQDPGLPHLRERAGPADRGGP